MGKKGALYGPASPVTTAASPTPTSTTATATTATLLFLLLLLPPPALLLAPPPPRPHYVEEIRPVQPNSANLQTSDVLQPNTVFQPSSGVFQPSPGVLLQPSQALLQPYSSTSAGQETMMVPAQPVSQSQIIPMSRKRAAIVLDKLMFALQRALDAPASPGGGGGGGGGVAADSSPSSSSVSSSTTSLGARHSQFSPPYPRHPHPLASGPLDLQRRGNGEGRLYWRCYFNAVSCF